MSASPHADAVRDRDGSVAESPSSRSSSEEAPCLDALDRRHLGRMLRAERFLPAFVWVNLGVAVALVAYYSRSGSWSGVRAVLVLLILLSARAHLRQLRSARLLRKLSDPETASG